MNRRPLWNAASLVALVLFFSACPGDEEHGCEVPESAVLVRPGESIQAIVDAHPEGTSFLLGAGLHRLQMVVPRAGDAFYGERDDQCRRLTTLSGARVLTGFEASGDLFTVQGQTQEGPQNGVCEPGWERCVHPEALYLDHFALRHVGSVDEVGPGSWHFDYAQDTIYLGDDPTGRLVETTVTLAAFAPTAPDVTVRGLVVEKYANSAQRGAIGGSFPEARWHVADNEVRLNHGVGIKVGSHSRVEENTVRWNGQLGVSALGEGVVIEDNEISSNGYAGFLSTWEAGGAKFSYTTDLVVRGNCVHHNRGSGLWSDIDNFGTLYEQNVVYANWDQGIFHEISFDAVIRRNEVGLNGLNTRWVYGANIMVSTSSNVEVYENRVEVAPNHGHGITLVWQDRGEGYEATGNHIHDNYVTFLGPAGLNGAAADFELGWDEVFDRNRFDGNRYYLPDPGRAHFAWEGLEVPFASFQAFGQEGRGEVDTRIRPRVWSCEP